MKFKIGDKVKIIANDDGSKDFIGNVGEIIETDRIKRGNSGSWDYSCKFDNGETYPFGPHEMIMLPTKGKQLLFSFMSAIDGT